jgi:alkylation response protein AidB-like acyl-CoA dehydrogenase
VDFSYEVLKDSPEEEAWRRTCRDFVESAIRPYMREWEAEDVLAVECYRRLAKFGYIAMSFPERLGGTDLSLRYRAIAHEELRRAGDGPGSYMVGLGSIYGWLLDDGAAEHEELLKAVLRGEHMIAFCETEPGGGSDAAAIKTTATRDGDLWVLDGQKTFLSTVPGADLLIVTALTNPEAGGKRGMSLFLVPDKTPGVEIWEIPTPEVKAWHTFGSMKLHDVRVPGSALLGDVNRGFYHIKERAWSRRIALPRNLREVGLYDEDFTQLLLGLQDEWFGGDEALDVPWVLDQLIRTLVINELQRLLALKGEWVLQSGGRATGGASQAMLFGKVFGREALLARMDLLSGEGIIARDEEMKRFVAATGGRAAGGGVDTHRIIVGQELYGAEWAVHK